MNNPHGYSLLDKVIPEQKTSQQLVSDVVEGEGVVLYEIASGDVDALGRIGSPNKVRHLSSSNALDVTSRFCLQQND
jgi:hypothetical protein